MGQIPKGIRAVRPLINGCQWNFYVLENNHFLVNFGSKMAKRNDTSSLKRSFVSKNKIFEQN